MAARKGGNHLADVLITLADVEPAVRLNALLEEAGFSTALVSPIDDLRDEIARARPELIVLTGNLADPLNQKLVRDQLWDGVAVVGLADIADPVLIEKLMSIGFVDIYTKPVAPAELADAVRRVLERHRLAESTGLIGQSAAIREVLVRVEQMAPVSSTVLIDGESGTGKELAARAIHNLSQRKARPFIAVNVGALPETLLESELFGHEKGAFTGAAERRLGRFELANEGTLFLDEIGEIPLSTQVKLLRILEEREVTRVGGVKAIPVNVRVVAATNQPMSQLVHEGKFRADLYYRLNVLSISLPPLRDRREDIPLLIRRFIREFTLLHDRPFRGISAEAMRILVQYSWPGNVRQLRNLIESMVVLAPGREITPDDIPAEVRTGGRPSLLPVHIPTSPFTGDDRAGAGSGSVGNAGGGSFGGPVPAAAQGSARVSGPEFEFILRSLLDLKLQVEELRSRLGEKRDADSVTSTTGPFATFPSAISGKTSSSDEYDDFTAEIEPLTPPSSGDSEEEKETLGFVVSPSMTMAEIEREAIESAVRASGGNRRKAAKLLGIGERTMYRKLKEYGFDSDE